MSVYDCPVCGAATIPVRGHASLCLRCTEDEIGCTYEELRTRVNEARTVKRKWKL